MILMWVISVIYSLVFASVCRCGEVYKSNGNISRDTFCLGFFYFLNILPYKTDRIMRLFNGYNFIIQSHQIRKVLHKDQSFKFMTFISYTLMRNFFFKYCSTCTLKMAELNRLAVHIILQPDAISHPLGKHRTRSCRKRMNSDVRGVFHIYRFFCS